MFQERQGMLMWLVLGELESGRGGVGRGMDGEVGRASSHRTSGARGSSWDLNPICNGKQGVRSLWLLMGARTILEGAQRVFPRRPVSCGGGSEARNRSAP